MMAGIRIKFMVVLVLILPMMLGASDKVSKPNHLDDQAYTDPSKALYVFKNASQFSIKVSSNPTTGYHWYLTDYDARLIQPMSHKFYPSSTDKLGAPGYDIWVFKVTPGAFLVPHLLKVGMQYSRPFQVSITTQNRYYFVATSEASSAAS